MQQFMAPASNFGPGAHNLNWTPYYEIGMCFFYKVEKVVHPTDFFLTHPLKNMSHRSGPGTHRCLWTPLAGAIQQFHMNSEY